MTKIVSNTGPLIALASIGYFDLLHKLFGEVYIPPAVRAEVLDKNTLDALEGAAWVTVLPVADRIAVQLLRDELDAGESEAIILAREADADLLLLDERAARRKAKILNLSMIGTLGILLMAKREGLIASLKPLLDELLHVGFRMSDELYQQVCETADEKV